MRYSIHLSIADESVCLSHEGRHLRQLHIAAAALLSRRLDHLTDSEREVKGSTLESGEQKRLALRMRSQEVQAHASCLCVKSSRKPMETPLLAERAPTSTPSGTTSTGVAASFSRSREMRDTSEI